MNILKNVFLYRVNKKEKELMNTVYDKECYTTMKVRKILIIIIPSEFT